MTPVGQRAVSFEVADMAVEIERIAGEQRLLSSQVSQSIQTLTTLVHEVQAEQLRAREDRMQQTTLLTSLGERAAAVPAGKLHDIELKVAFWRGVVVCFAAVSTVVIGLCLNWADGKFATGATERGRLEQRIEQLERRP